MYKKLTVKSKIQGPVVRRLDGAIQRIARFSSFLKQLVNRSDSD